MDFLGKCIESEKECKSDASRNTHLRPPQGKGYSAKRRDERVTLVALNLAAMSNASSGDMQAR